MQPIEINAGGWYLRALRSDERMDDRPALADLGTDDPGYVARCEADWAADRRYSWAVCEPTTGEMLAELTLDPATGAVDSRARDGHAEAARVGADAVRRFAAAHPLG
ncbi:hypothetical protein [Mycolicibacterium fallax]|uniref:Uncharacterized protein n=1 Tax=Mycolicibacterium fallax TaxID=1793 RepID=A0A1X1REW0_MYCFA|nr:hypothetical protein [Mycolicibacterium fallax]ORV04290.1 hypothetical protein AWC04_09070 [Mycolicibacterium fallax]BBY98470.1 hypothetical protein MFAL_19370 [Mycolicibacterium fallax]HOW95382.1 hypothetical protein [Mycolicibacterium fallax]